MCTVVCKATYELRPGESPFAATQEPIHTTEKCWSADPAWSLYAGRDVVPARPRVDVVVVGHAFAPNEMPVASLIARICVADVDKSVEVWCDRWFTADGTLQRGADFARMPLLYEYAAGGPETMNPVGIKPDTRDNYGKRSVPNLQRPGLMIKSPTDVIEPVALGPIAASWSARQRKLGRYASTWNEETFHHQPLPQDMDMSYFNVAPSDQQATALQGNERIVLDNLHPTHSHLVTTLASTPLHAVVERPGRRRQTLPMRPDLLWIHTDRGICTLTFRGQMAIDHAHEPGTVRVSLADARRGPGDEAFEEHNGYSEETRIGINATALLQQAAQNASSGLPFVQSSALPSQPSRPSSPEPHLTGTPFTGAPSPLASGATPPPFVSATPPVVAQPPIQPIQPVQPVQAPPIVDSPWASAAARNPNVSAPPAASSIVAPTLGAVIAAGAVAVAARPDAAPPAQGSATAASNAAAEASAAWNLSRARSYRPSPTEPALEDFQDAQRTEMIQLIWLDPPSVPRVRRQPAWKRILAELEEEPPDVELDEAGPSEPPVEIEDRREVFEILARGAPINATGIQEAFATSVRDGGKFAAPMTLVAGELTFPFDELETLKATVAVVTPLMGNDEPLKAAVANAQELIKLPDLRTAPAVVEALTARIVETFGQGKRSLPSNYLDKQVERALLEQRHYQRRALFGGPQLRALLTPPGSSQPIPSYMPDSLAQKLPMYQRFKARMIVEIHPQADQYETSPTVLRVVALGRALPQPAAPTTG